MNHEEMDDLRKKVIRGMEHCIRRKPCDGCPYENGCEIRLFEDALDVLKAQEPHILTEADFENADDDGFIPAWCEESGGDQYWECITGHAVLPNKNYRYWSSRPTDEQRKAVKWNE